MFNHPLTATGVLMAAYSVFAFYFFLSAESAERDARYLEAYMALGLGAFFILLGVIIQGFKRIERLLIFRNIDALEADGELGKLWDNSEVRAAYLKGDRK